MPLRHALIVLLSLAAASCGGHLGVTAPGQVDLSGHWSLNEQLSENPERVVREQLRRERPDRQREVMPGHIGGPLDNGPNRPPEVGQRGGSGYRTLWERAMREKIDMLSAGPKLEISQSATELRLVSGESAVRYVYGDKVIISVPNGVADRLAGWDGRRFIVRTQAPDGVRSARSYELANGGRQLIVTTEVAGDGPTSTARLVFDRTSG